MLRAGLALVALAAAVAGAACADDPGADPAADADAAPARPDATPRCRAPGAEPSWLAAYEAETLAKLTGAAEIAPGVSLAARASEAEREAVRVYLQAELARWGLAVERQSYATGANVVARLPSTTGGADVVVLGAHFDGVPAGPAAADNGTGVALVLAAARHLADVPCREVELVFALFDEEEKGLIGSRAFAAELVASGAAVRAVHVFDMISFDGDGDGAAELWSPSPALAERYRAAAAARGVELREVEFASSDHDAFLDRGLPTTGVSEEYVSGDHTPHYHLATDTYENVDRAYLASISALALHAVGLDVGAD